MYIDIPKDVKNIIDIFRENGYEAYAVGGCVRDALLKRIPKDWDITTSAKPEDIKRLFSKTIDTGIAHGTVTVRMSGESYEVTTYRIDGKYEDNRHPDSVTFTASLKEDLKRRDFTINAMAYAPDEGIIDIYGGVKDLNDGIIRCVGNPKERFDEDALRTLRAVRFAGQLGFNIEPETLDAVKEAAVRINNVSSERIRVEISKLIASEFPDRLLLAYETGLTAQFLPEWDDMMKTPQNNPNHIYNVGIHSIKVVEGVNRIYSENDEREKRILTWSALLHDIAKPMCRTVDEKGMDHFYGHPDKGSAVARDILKRLKFDNYTINMVSRIIYYHDYRFDGSRKQTRRFISKAGIDIMPYLFILMEADVMAQSDFHREDKLNKLCETKQRVQEIVEANESFTLKDMNINGRDLINMGISEGKMIGNILNELFEDILENPAHNNREYLREKAEKIFSKNM